MVSFASVMAWSRARIREIPRDDDGCGWFAQLPGPSPVRPLDGEVSADVAILGAGFTGLAAARRIVELDPRRRVVVVDAQRAGYGASGRSSGFVVDLAGFIAAMEPAEQRRFVRLSRMGIRELETRVEHHGIECAWDDGGWLHVAGTSKGLTSLDSLERWLAGRDAPYERLDAADMERFTGSSYYLAGIRLPGSVLIQPAALVRGLAESLPPEVTLHEGTRVAEIARTDQGWKLVTPGGSVTAPRLLLATNGALPEQGVLRRRLFPLYTFASLTRPLTDEEQAALGGEREWGLLAQDPMGSSLRRTRDQRILIRNTVWYSRNLRQVPTSIRSHAVAEHRRALAGRFPRLAEIPFEHTWAGLMGMSGNLRPYFGRLDDGLFAAGGYHGAGIAFGTTAGRLLAEHALGVESPELDDVRALPGPRWIPPEPFLGWGVRLRLAWDQWKTGGEI